tara:strand:+ start:210 stop:410 length:201 start_codon:yes stop_codon:yes gene_type:complete
MVTSEYHTKEFKGRRVPVGYAKPFKGGRRNREEGETTGRGTKGPQGGAHKVVFKIVLFILTTKDTG